METIVVTSLIFFVATLLICRLFNHVPSLHTSISSNERANELLNNIVVSSDSKEKIHFYINQKRKIDAIKELRLASGLDLRDSKEVIDELMSSNDINRLRTGATASNLIAGTVKEVAPPALADQAKHNIEDLVRNGQLIEAIKEYREATGANLVEAKNYVEKLKSKY